MSYAARNVRVFRESGDAQTDVCKKRSEGRLKAYPSATDNRAWITEREQRRQHILDLVNQDSCKSMQLGKYVPIEVLIDTLLANKNADIEKLRQQVDELQKLLECYEKLDLTPEQRSQLDKMKKDIVKAGSDMDRQSARTGASSRAGGVSDGEGKGGPSDGRGGVDGKGKRGAKDADGGSDTSSGRKRKRLTLEELQYMHNKVCECSAKILQHGGAATPDNQPRRRGMPIPPTDLSDRQRQAQELITRLQSEINVEKMKLRELKANLQQEKDTNIGLINKIKAQSKTVNMIKSERDNMMKLNTTGQDQIQKYTSYIQNEKIRVQQLEQELARERENNRQLKNRINNTTIQNETLIAQHTDDRDGVRFQLNKVITSEMMLKLDMEQSSTRPQSNAGRPGAAAPQGKPPPKIKTTTFYTELRVENNEPSKVQMNRVEKTYK